MLFNLGKYGNLAGINLVHYGIDCSCILDGGKIMNICCFVIFPVEAGTVYFRWIAGRSKIN